MKLIDQCCTLEQAKLLKSLGVKQDGYYCHAHLVKGLHQSFDGEVTEWNAEYSEDVELIETSLACFDGLPHYSAFTVAELGVMIGKGTNAASLLYDAVQARMNQSHSFSIVFSVQFVANCVIGMLETGRLTVEEVNARLCA